MRNYKKYMYGILVGITLSFGACNKADLTIYDDPVGAVNFVKKTQAYSFITKPQALKDTVALPVQISGFPADRDRTFDVNVIKDSLTTAKPEYYRILEGVVKAKEFNGNLLVEITKTGELDTMDLSLHLRLKNSADFKAGNAETDGTVLTWTNEYIQFPNWSRIRAFFCLQYSTEVHRRIIEATGMTDFTSYPKNPDGSVGISYGQMIVYGTQFGDLIRAYAAKGITLKHDNGPYAGRVITPIY